MISVKKLEFCKIKIGEKFIFYEQLSIKLNDSNQSNSLMLTNAKYISINPTRVCFVINHNCDLDTRKFCDLKLGDKFIYNGKYMIKLKTPLFTKGYRSKIPNVYAIDLNNGGAYLMDDSYQVTFIDKGDDV